jgi:hypothetical protein
LPLPANPPSGDMYDNLRLRDGISFILSFLGPIVADIYVLLPKNDLLGLRLEGPRVGVDRV